MILLRYNDFSTGGELILKFYDYPIISKESSLPVFLVSVGLNEWQYHVKCDKGDNYAKALYCTKGSGVSINRKTAEYRTSDTMGITQRLVNRK